MFTSRRRLIQGTSATLAFSGLARYASAQDRARQASAAEIEADAYRREVYG